MTGSMVSVCLICGLPSPRIQWIANLFNPSSHLGRGRVPHPFLGRPEQPLYEIKANLFKALAHPARIRVLEILSSTGRPTSVSEILDETGLEPTLLSQHLAVLKRHHVVSAQRVGNAVIYELAHPKISELLVIARTFLADTLDAQRDQWDALKTLPPLGRRE
jgi:DNA-binding transcriptional ArsR family regulator